MSLSRLRLHLSGDDTFDVRSFSVEERISSLFEVRVVAVSRNPSVDLDALAGERAVFRAIAGEGGPHHGARAWSGIASSIGLCRVEERGLSTYEIVVAPMMWLLTQRRNHRVFQHASELDIALEILGEWGIGPELRVDRAGHGKREYRVQYGETDHAFVSRMLEEAGISYFFESDGDESRLVLSDAPHLAEPSPPLPFRDRPGEHVARPHVTAVRLDRRVRPGKVTMIDHDTRLPAGVSLSAEVNGAGNGVESALESFEHRPGAFSYATDKGERLPFGDDKGKVRSDSGAGAAVAQRRLQSQRSGARTCSFRTNLVELGPGSVTSFLDHPHAALAPDNELLITATRISGTPETDWHIEQEAASGDSPYRPPLDTPKPRVAGVEHATVVGPPGEEIHTDEMGRVRVQFHWDRRGRKDQDSSCWIPTSQPWSGAGFGGIHLPRVGQEVLVEFVGGDPDQPVIVGRVYTSSQKTPQRLPAEKTKSGFRTMSTPGGGGYNEIMFEDRKGGELLNIQAERDMAKLVKHDEAVAIGRDRAATIGRDRSTAVGRDEALSVGHDRTLLVENDESVQVGHDRTALVKNDEEAITGHDATRLIGNNAREMVGGSRARAVGVNETVEVGQDQAVTVGARQLVTVGDTQTITIGEKQTVTIGGEQSVSVGQTATEKVGMAKAVTVGGAYQITVTGAMNTTVMGLSAEEVGLLKKIVSGLRIELSCGDSRIVMERSGKITIEGTELKLVSKGPVSVEGKEITIEGEKMLAKASGNVGIEGAAVQITGDPVDLN